MQRRLSDEVIFWIIGQSRALRRLALGDRWPEATTAKPLQRKYRRWLRCEELKRRLRRGN